MKRKDYRELIEYYNKWADIAIANNNYTAARGNTINCIRAMIIHIKIEHC